MRKFLALIGLAALLCSSASWANSQWVWDDVVFRTSAINGAGYVDSSTFSHTTAAWGAATLAVGGVDTTAAIPVTGRGLFDFPPMGPTTAATDSSTFAIISIFTAGSNAATDTMFVDGQVSMDGANWVNLGVTTANLGSGQGLFNSRAIPALLEDGTTESFRGRFRYLLGATVNSFGITAPGATPSWAQIWGWKFIRFIVYADGICQHRMQIGHWVDTPS